MKQLQEEQQMQYESVYINFGSEESVKEFIDTHQNGFYVSRNDIGEEIGLALEKDSGLTLVTFQENGWTRHDEFDLNGYHQIQTLAGRWK